jgi:hypothetical protein
VEGSKDDLYGKKMKLNRQFASFIADGVKSSLYEIVQATCFSGIFDMLVECLELMLKRNLDEYEICLVKFLVVEEHAWWEIPSMRRKIVVWSNEVFDIDRKSILEFLRLAKIPGDCDSWNQENYVEIIQKVFEPLQERKDEMNRLFRKAGFKIIPDKGTQTAMTARIRYVALGEGVAVNVCCNFASVKKREN